MNNEEINEVLTSFISNNSGGELVQLLKEHPKLSTDEGLQELRELCEIQGNTGHRFSLLWLLDLLESSSEIGVETAVEDYELKTTLAEELGSILVFVLPVYRDSQQAKADSFLNNIEFLLGVLQRELLRNDAIISRYPALSLIQHYLEVSDEELSDFIDKHPELFSKDVLALIGLLKIVASEPKVENHIRRRRRLLRKYKAEGKVEALGKYHGLSFVPEGTYEFYDFFWHHIQEAHEGGHLITKELSPTVISVACKRFIASQLTNGQLFEVDNKEEWFEIGVKLCTLLQKQDYSLVDEIISKFNIAGEVYDKQHFEVIDFINCSDNYATNLGSHTPFINLIVHILSDHTSSKTDKDTKIPALTYETNMPTEYQNFPKGIPTVNLGHTQEDQATGSVTVDTSNFYINRPDGILRLPLIFDYRILHYYQVGPYKTLIVTNCPSVGGVRYKYIMYVFREDEVEPYLVIGAETNVFFQKELQKLTPSGYEVVLPLYLGIFTTRGHSTLGMSAELNSIEEFASAAHNILKAYYKVLDNPIEISTDPHIDLINSSLDGIYESIQRGDYANSLPSLISIAKHLKGTAYRNPLSRTLLYLTWCYTELGHIAEAKACAIEGLDLERSRVKNNSIAVFLFELAKLAYLENKHSDALNQCHEAINLKLQTPVRITQGLASYVMPFNDDVGAELLLLALLLRESTSYQKSIELLEILRAKCEQSFNSNMLGVTLDELGIVFFEKGEYLKAISCFIEAISIKLKSDDYIGIQRSISILQTCCVKHPSANSYETKEHIRESRVLI